VGPAWGAASNLSSMILKAFSSSLLYPKERSLIFESAWKKEKDIVSKEIEKLRVSIQTLCKSALPLGKIMDYIQEDVDAMQNELQLWHSENRQHAEALSQEQRWGLRTDGTTG
jgi:hypothetical protein